DLSVSTTAALAVVRARHDLFAPRGVAVLDAPVSGGPAGARSRRLAIWVGGSRVGCNRVRSGLEAMGAQPYYVGPIGAGAVAKLVHNCASFTIRTVLAEVFSMGVKAGVAPELLWQGGRGGGRA